MKNQSLYPHDAVMNIEVVLVLNIIPIWVHCKVPWDVGIPPAQQEVQIKIDTII